MSEEGASRGEADPSEGGVSGDNSTVCDDPPWKATTLHGGKKNKDKEKGKKKGSMMDRWSAPGGETR